MALTPYVTGTVSVSANGTVVTGSGTIWTGTNAFEGDRIVIDDEQDVLITGITDATHLTIPKWPYGNKSAVSYAIYKTSALRFDDVQIAQDLQDQVAALNTAGFIVFVDPTLSAPDPSLGDNGQYATQPNTGKWWIKTAGVWVLTTAPLAGYGGTSSTSLAIGTGSKVFTTQAGLAYNGARVRAASAANPTNYMEGIVTYSGTTLTMVADAIGGSGTKTDWVFSIAGAPGATGAMPPVYPSIRLTLTSNTAIMTSSVAAATTVYCTPYGGGAIPIYDGTNFTTIIFAEVSQATTDTTKSPAACAANKVYDKFAWIDPTGAVKRGTRGPTWDSGAVAGSNTARGTGAGSTELVWVNGIALNKYDITNGPAAQRGTYIGTIATNASSTVDFTFGSFAAGGGMATFGVWNAFNRIDVRTMVLPSEDSWTYNVSSVWRAPNGSTAYRVNMVRGLNEDGVQADYSAIGSPGAATALRNGIGVNSTSAVSGTTGFWPGGGALQQQMGKYSGLPGLGYRFISALEWNSSSTASTWYGDAGDNAVTQSGLHVSLRA